MIAVLFSGGVDSLVHLRWAQQRLAGVEAFYFDIGQAYAPRESARAEELARHCGAPFHLLRPMRLREDPETAQVEFRNAFFLLWLASLPSRPDGAVFGMLLGESPADKTPRFVRGLQRIVDDTRAAGVYSDAAPCRIYTPFSGHTKAEMVRWYLGRGYDADLLSLSVGCFSVSEPMCGRCWSCINRWIAWEENGLALERFLEHPAEALLQRFKAAREGGREGRGLTLRRAWSRRRWVSEARHALDRHVRATRGTSALMYTIRSCASGSKPGVKE